MTLLAAFDLLLWRYAGQEVLVGTPIANRNAGDGRADRFLCEHAGAAQ